MAPKRDFPEVTYDQACAELRMLCDGGPCPHDGWSEPTHDQLIEIVFEAGRKAGLEAAANAIRALKGGA